MFFDIAFSPLSAIEYNIDLTLVTSLNDTYIVKVHGLAVEPPVVFSSAVVKLQGTGPGGRVVENVLVTNNTKKRQIVEIMLPVSLLDILFALNRIQLSLCESHSAAVHLITLLCNVINYRSVSSAG